MTSKELETGIFGNLKALNNSLENPLEIYTNTQLGPRTL